ncbi:MAG: hypothetical protein JW714_02980 [Candidatus Omnitrophica bacterium]|nr:hypothetical protein [Candidatus Omnitrophota bacterium]
MQTMQEQINSLAKIQEIDSGIYKLREQAQAKPAEKLVLEENFAQSKQGLKAKEETLKSLQLKRKEREIDLETKEKEIKKYQAQLMQVKTNKEYLSLQKEIEGLKADNAVLEDEILELMDKIDQVKAEIEQERDNLTSEEKRLKEDTAKIDQEVKAIQEQISGLENQRNQLSADIDKTLFTRYERVLKAKGGLAFVPIIGESCGGCHRVLPPQVISEAQMKDKIITCEFCACLLYWMG